MLSIGIFTECYHPMRNGVVVSVASFARMLALMGHQVTIFAAHHPDLKEPEEGVLRFPSITFPVSVRYPIAVPIARGEVRRILRQQHFDVLHSHSLMSMGHVARYYRRRRGIPLVFTYHTLIEEYAHYVPLPQGWVRRRAIQMSREYCNAVDHVIAPAPHVAQLLRSYHVTKPITVIPTGIEVDLIDEVPFGGMRERYQIPDGVPLLAYAGRVAREKNLPRLLTAFRAVLREEPDTHLLLIGGGPDEPLVRDMAQQLGVGHRTRMTGLVTRDEVIQGLHESDVFVFTSKTETQGLVLGEAMACKLPVVAVEADASREVLAGGRSGRLVPDADEAIAESVVEVLRTPALRAELSAQARMRAEELSSRQSTELLVDVFCQVIGIPSLKTAAEKVS